MISCLTELRSHTEKGFGEEKVEAQAQGVHDGGDEGRRHHRRVEAQPLGDQGQGAAHHFGHDDGDLSLIHI